MNRFPLCDVCRCRYTLDPVCQVCRDRALCREMDRGSPVAFWLFVLAAGLYAVGVAVFVPIILIR